MKIVEGNDTLFEHLAKGGSVGAVIIALGVVCLLIGLFKAYEITGYKTPTRTDVQEVLTFIEAGKVSEAQKFASILPGVGGEL